MMQRHTNRIDIDASSLDIHQYPDGRIIDWYPGLELLDFNSTSKLYLDIETYSNNYMVVDAFINSIKYGLLSANDKPMIRFLSDKLPINMNDYLDGQLIGRVSDMNDCNNKLDLLEWLEDNYQDLISTEEEIDSKAALHPDRAKIILIGLMNERGESFIIDCLERGEANGIRLLYEILDQKKPVFLAHFNGFNFDLPFIHKRGQDLGLSSKFWVSPRDTVFRTAQMFGKPVEYRSFWINHGATAIIDLYHQALAWDYVNRKLTGFSLKEIPIQLGLRKEKRLILSHHEMRRIVESGDLTELKEYLIYDLEDSKLLGDLLLPDIYYQKRLLPDWNLQSISTAGMGSKWNDILMKIYQQEKRSVRPDEVCNYEGGLVVSKAGLYQNVSKIDVASMYPSIMLMYHVHSRKDTSKYILGVLKYLKAERLRLKEIASRNPGTPEGTLARQMQGALKVMINSSYGSLGTAGKEYNDYHAAALVTAYGRKILMEMMVALVEAGGAIITADTDGVFYTCGSFEKNIIAWQYCQSKMPGNEHEKITLEYELEAAALYIPPVTSSKEHDEDNDGLRKNYIIIKKDGSLKMNGKFRKRDKCELEKSFTPGLIQAYLEGRHQDYCLGIIQQLMLKIYPVGNLVITRKIKVNERRLIELGIGSPNEVVSIYKAKDKKLFGKKGQQLKKVEIHWTDDPAFIDWDYYIEMVNSQYEEFFIQIQKF